MVNKTSAIEWLNHSYHDLNGAILLFKADHYTDTISYVLQQALEKMLKSILASQNKPIKKIHNLLDVYDSVATDTFVLCEEELMYLSIATTYYTKQKYPVQEKKLPPKDEIKEILDFAKELFDRVCSQLNIDVAEVKK